MPSPPPYRAVGVIEGVFLPGEGRLIAANGEEFGCSQTQRHRQKWQKDAERYGQARLHIVYPRTTRDGLHLTLVKSLPPGDPELGDAQKRAGQFEITGLVVNQRGVRNQVVLRVNRNVAAAKGQHRWAANTSHLLFLEGRLSPSGQFLNRVVSLRCRLVGRQLAVVRVVAVSDPQDAPIDWKGLRWPWPFLAGNASIQRMAELNREGKPPVIVGPTAAAELQELAAKLGKSAASASRAAAGRGDATEARDLDRIRLIAKRIGNFTGRLDPGTLEPLLEQTGLLQMLRAALNPAHAPAPAVIPPEPEPEPKAAPEPAKQESLDSTQRQLANPEPEPVAEILEIKPKAARRKKEPGQIPAQWEPLAQMLLAGYIDGLINALGIHTRRIGTGSKALIDAGWLDTLTKDQLKRIDSYQFKKAAAAKGIVLPK